MSPTSLSRPPAWAMISRTVAVSTPCCAAAASMAASGLPPLLVRLAWNVFAIAAKVSRAGCDSLSREVRFGSLWLHACKLDHPGPLLGFVSNELAEVRG
jgi:hypothetical protein